MTEAANTDEVTYIPPSAEKPRREQLAESNPRLLNNLLPGSERRGSVSSGLARDDEAIDALTLRPTSVPKPPAVDEPPADDVAVLETAAASATPAVAERLTGIAGEIRAGHIEGLEQRRSAIEDALATVDETLLGPEKKAEWIGEVASITEELNRLRPPADEVDGGDYTPEELAAPAVSDAPPAPPPASEGSDAEREAAAQAEAEARVRQYEEHMARLDDEFVSLDHEEKSRLRHLATSFNRLSGNQRHETWSKLSDLERFSLEQAFHIVPPTSLPAGFFDEEV